MISFPSRIMIESKPRYQKGFYFLHYNDELKKVPKLYSDTEKEKRIRESFNELMTYDYSTALGGNRNV